MNVEKIREDFAILNSKKPPIYFDSACVSLKPVQVIEACDRYYNEFPGCAGRSVHKIGRRVTEEVDNSRETIRKFLNAKKANEIIFTKNTTEGINIIANSLKLKEGDEVLTSDKEHNSGLLPFQRLRKKGIKHGIFEFGNVEDFKRKINRNVKLVSFLHTSNLDGTSNPIKELIKIAHENGSLVLIDGAQSVPHRETDVRKLDCDFLAFSGHKMLGPSGTGILYGKLDLLEKLDPVFIGGETVKNSTYESYEPEDVPERFEPGLQNYAGVIGLAEASKYLMRAGFDGMESHEIELNKIITEGLLDLGVDILGGNDYQNRGGIVSFNIKGIEPHMVAGMLSEGPGIMIRSGMHCVHSWFNAHNIKGSARASLYLYNTKEECQIFVDEIKKIWRMAGK